MPERQGPPETTLRGARRERFRSVESRPRAALSVSEASAGMRIMRLSVRAPDVVFVKGVIEASEGLAVVFAERGGELTVASPFGRGPDLEEILGDLADEVGGTVHELGRPEP